MKTGAAGPGRGVPHDMRDESCPACAESVSDHQNDVDTWIACSHCGTWYLSLIHISEPTRPY